MNKEYLLEEQLKELNPDLHNRFSNNVNIFYYVLNRFQILFPEFTDHSMFHSLDVLDLCNKLLGQRIEYLNADECFILCMSCYMHDIGMGISETDFYEFSKRINFGDYFEKNPDAPISKIVRDFHHDYSGAYIDKYWELYDLPSKEYATAIKQVSRGHRVTNLKDEKEYPNMVLENGNIVHLAYLASIIRFADELDVTVDRNPKIIYDSLDIVSERQIREFAKHEAIRSLDIKKDEVVLNVHANDDIYQDICVLRDKIQKTLDYCNDVNKNNKILVIDQKRVVINRI